MAGGISGLRYIQLGKETTAGTIAVATAIWRGVGTMEDRREVTFPEEEIGIISGTDRSYIAKLAAGIPFEETPATFEQLPYLLEASLKKVGTGAADGVGTDLIYTYPLPTTTVPTIQSYTIENGDNQQGEVMEYGVVESLSLTGAAGESVMMSAEWIGRQVAKQAKTGALSVPEVTSILFGTGKLYIDDASGTIGTTEKSCTMLGMEFNLTTGWHGIFTNSNLYFCDVGFDASSFEATLNITFLHNGAAVAEKDAWRAETGRLVRMDFLGPAVATPGTAHSNKTLRLDLAGKWETFEKLDEQDGDDIVTGTLRVRYNATYGKTGEIVVVNELASLT